MWLWVPNWKKVVALNNEIENRDGSECRNRGVVMALNVETESDDGSECQDWKCRWLWTPKLRSDEGSERQTENSDSYEYQN